LRLLIFKLPEPVFGPLIYAEKWLQAESVIHDHRTQGQHWFFGRRGSNFGGRWGTEVPQWGPGVMEFGAKPPEPKKHCKLYSFEKYFRCYMWCQSKYIDTVVLHKSVYKM